MGQKLLIFVKIAAEQEDRNRLNSATWSVFNCLFLLSWEQWDFDVSIKGMEGCSTYSAVRENWHPSATFLLKNEYNTFMSENPKTDMPETPGSGSSSCMILKPAFFVRGRIISCGCICMYMCVCVRVRVCRCLYRNLTSHVLLEGSEHRRVWHVGCPLPA